MQNLIASLASTSSRAPLHNRIRHLFLHPDPLGELEIPELLLFHELDEGCVPLRDVKRFDDVGKYYPSPGGIRVTWSDGPDETAVRRVLPTGSMKYDVPAGRYVVTYWFTRGEFVPACIRADKICTILNPKTHPDAREVVIVDSVILRRRE